MQNYSSSELAGLFRVRVKSLITLADYSLHANIFGRPPPRKQPLQVILQQRLDIVVAVKLPHIMNPRQINRHISILGPPASLPAPASKSASCKGRHCKQLTPVPKTQIHYRRGEAGGKHLRQKPKSSTPPASPAIRQHHLDVLRSRDCLSSFISLSGS